MTTFTGDTAVHHDAAGARALVVTAFAVGLLPLVVWSDLPAVAFAVFIGVGAFLMLLGLRPMPAPVAFLRRGGTFAVPATLAWAAYVAGLLLIVEVLFAGLVGIFLIMLIVPPVVRVLRDRPLVELTPAGVVVRGLLRPQEIAWADLRRPSPSSGTGTSLRLVRNGASRPRFGTTLSFAFLGIDSEFLLNAIRYYVDHPEERATIGSEAAHDHLLTLH